MSINSKNKFIIEGLTRFSKNKGAVIGLFFLFFLITISIFSDIILKHPPNKTNVGESFSSPGINWPFGTDNLGRDIFSDVIHGTRTSIKVGLFSIGVSTIFGIFIGTIAGYFGGIIDELLMRFTEFFLVLPQLLLALVLSSILGSSLNNIILIIALLSWPSTARLLRSEFLYKKEASFVEAAKSIGMPEWKIAFSEILPNALTPVVVNSSLQIARAILTEAGLSFLGLGDPNITSWGKMLSNARPFLRKAWWMAFFPGLAIFLTVLFLNILGDGLNDMLNPRLREQ